MKKYLVVILLLIFTLPVFAKNTILVLGDSLSAGYGLLPDAGWVRLLQNRLDKDQYDYQVVNASISGDTTSNGLARLPKALQQYHPAITIIELGGNDGLRGLPLEVIKRNLQQMVQMTKNAGSQVLIVGIRLPPNFGPQYTDAFYQIYKDLARDNQITFVPNFLKGVDENLKMMQPDKIHPTLEAQSIILENVWVELQKMLHR